MSDLKDVEEEEIYQLGLKYETAKGLAFIAYQEGLNTLQEVAIKRRDEAKKLLQEWDQQLKQEEESGDL